MKRFAFQIGDHVLVPEGVVQFPLRGRVMSYGSGGGKRFVTTRVWLDELPLDAVEIRAAERCATCGKPTDDSAD